MSNMSSWNIVETRKHIEQRFGLDQVALAKPSINSLVDRLNYARYHFQEVGNILEKFKDIHLSHKPIFAISFGSEVEREEFDIFAISSGANTVACIQSIHSIADLLATAIFFSLGLNFRQKSLREFDITSYKLIKLLRSDSIYPSIETILTQFRNDTNFNHVGALANKAKHQRIVKTGLYEDWTAKAINRHEFRFGAFQHSGTDYPETPITDLLESAYALASNIIITVGNEINRLYTTNAV